MPIGGTQIANLYGVLSLQDNLSGTLNNANTNLGSFGKKLSSTGADITRMGVKISALTAPLAGIGFLAVKTAVNWESAFAGVRKTVDGTDEELAALEQGLRDMASGRTGSPVAALEDAHMQLAAIAEAAGQLGVGTNDILGFTEAVGMLAMSTNITAENGAMMAAQFANMTDLDLSDMDKFASVIVDLGNNSATTENDILVLGQRIAAAGDAAGLSWNDILAFSAAIASMGFQPEAAGTALSQFLNDMVLWTSMGMTDELKTLSDVVGMTAEDFTTLFKAAPDQALLTFFDALGDLPEGQQLQVLSDLGVDGARAIPILRGLAENSEMLADSLGLSQSALENNNAALIEATKRAETTQGQWNKMKNTFNDFLITLGNHMLPAINDLIQDGLIPMANSMGEVEPETMKTVIAVGALLVALGPTITIVGNVVTVLGAFVSVLQFLGGPLSLLISLLVMGAVKGWPEFKAGIEDTLAAIKDGNMEGVLLGIANSIAAIAGGISLWIDEMLGFSIPDVWREFAGLVDGIAKSLGIIGASNPQSNMSVLEQGWMEDRLNPSGAPNVNPVTSAQGSIGINPHQTGQLPGIIGDVANFLGLDEMLTGGSSNAGSSSGNEFNMSGSTIILQGVQNPDQLLDELQQKAKSRGLQLGVPA